MRYYIDASAFVKLLVNEPESRALDAALGVEDRLLSSDLLKVEAHRALKRSREGSDTEAARWLGRVALLPIGAAIRDRACRIGPPLLRSLDALHLATMEESRTEIDGLISYDDRLIDAAQALGFRVLSPR